jgi:hypothetical protein
VQLRTGRTYEQAIRFLDDMTQGGMNDTNNSIPRIGSPSFEQMMPPQPPLRTLDRNCAEAAT